MYDDEWQTAYKRETQMGDPCSMRESLFCPLHHCECQEGPGGSLIVLHRENFIQGETDTFCRLFLSLKKTTSPRRAADSMSS